MKKNLLTVKEFSKLTHTPVDTIKHYDRINLLKPAAVGENSYRYYLPEQTLLLTRILFGVKAKVRLADIKNIILNDEPTEAYEHYKEMNENISSMIEDLKAVQGTLNNLEYYYELTTKHRLGEIFVNYFPEWFVISSPRLALHAKAGSIESNIADNLFLRGFNKGKWPHYLLGCMYSEEDIRRKDLTSPVYCLKVDNPEDFELEELRFVPSGDYYCQLLKVSGNSLCAAVTHFLATLAKERKDIQGNVFVLDVVNNFFTSRRECYCTLIYAHVAVRKEESDET